MSVSYGLNLLPLSNNTRDFGTSALRWKDAYLSGNVDADGTLDIAGTSTLAGEVTVGGGYGDTGVTVSDTGNVQANGTLTIDGTSTLTGEVQVGGGYGSSGVTVSDAGNVQANGTLTVDGISTLTGEVQVGGGYGDTGVTVSAAGNVQANGTLTVDGNATLSGTLDVAGGYGSTGVSIDASGNIQTNGDVTVDGNLTVTGTLTAGDTADQLDVHGLFRVYDGAASGSRYGFERHDGHAIATQDVEAVAAWDVCDIAIADGQIIFGSIRVAMHDQDTDEIGAVAEVQFYAHQTTGSRTAVITSIPTNVVFGAGWTAYAFTYSLDTTEDDKITLQALNGTTGTTNNARVVSFENITVASRAAM